MLDKIKKVKKMFKSRNSYYILVDKSLLDTINADPDEYFEVYTENGHIEIKPTKIVGQNLNEEKDFSLDIHASDMDNSSYIAFKRKLQQLLVAYKAKYYVKPYQGSKEILFD